MKAEVLIVVMDTKTGLWCPDCNKSTGVTVTVAIGLELVAITRCLECEDWTV